MTKKTVMIIYLGRRGGGNLDAYEAAMAFLQNGLSVIAVVSVYAENLADWQALPLQRLITVETYRNKMEFLWRSLQLVIFGGGKYEKLLREEKVDFIYTPMIALWTGFFYDMLPGVPKLTVIHDPEAHSGEKNRVYGYLYGRAIQGSDLLLVHTKRFVESTEEQYGKPTRYIPLGRHDFYKNIPDKSRIVSYDAEKWNYVFFGRISPYKGLNVLAEAYERIREKRADVTLTVVGNGDFSAYSERYAGLKDVTVVNRWIRDEELESVFLGKNLIAVLPYLDATQSGVVMVAMDYGVPVIASDTGGLAEQVLDGENGVLVKPGDAADLERAMLALVEDRAQYDRMGKNAAAYVQGLSWQASMQKVAEMAEEGMVHG